MFFSTYKKSNVSINTADEVQDGEFTVVGGYLIERIRLRRKDRYMHIVRVFSTYATCPTHDFSYSEDDHRLTVYWMNKDEFAISARSHQFYRELISQYS